MTRFLAAVVLGASMLLTTAAAFAEGNSAMDRGPTRQLVEQPATEAQDVAVVSGAPAQDNGPYHELRLDNLGQ